MEDSSIVQVQQLQILYRQRCPHHNLQRMFGTLWNVQSSLANIGKKTAWLGTVTTMVKCQTTTDERASQPWSRRSGVPVTSVADGERALCVWTSSTRNQTGDGALNRLQPVHQSFRHSQRTESCSSPDDRRRTPGPMFYSYLQTMTGQPAVSGASGSRHFDRPQWREALPTVMVFWNQATGLSLMVSEIFNGECDAMVDITLNEL